MPRFSNDFQKYPINLDHRQGDFRVTLIPTLVLTLYKVLPIHFELQPYMGVIASYGGCGAKLAAKFQLYMGLDFHIVVKQFTIDFKIVKIRLGSPVLPKTIPMTIVKKKCSRVGAANQNARWGGAFWR